MQGTWLMERDFHRPPSGSIREALLEVWEAHLSGVPIAEAFAQHDERIGGAFKMSAWACCTKCGLIKKEGELDYQHITSHKDHMMLGFKSFEDAVAWLEEQRADSRKSSLKRPAADDDIMGYPV